MTPWISTKERLPKRKDAGQFREVIVLFGGPRVVPEWQGIPKLIPWHLVRKSRHTHWTPIPRTPGSAR